MPNTKPNTVFIVANGDLRLAANRKCWPVQAEVEAAVTAAIERLGHSVRRGHDYDPEKQHGFIDSQKRGIEVFRDVPPAAPLVVVEAVWQYSQHLLPGLLHHEGPILTVANWAGQWPGLVGLLNLNASLRKAGKAFDTLWSERFDDAFFLDGLEAWLGSRGLPPPPSARRRGGAAVGRATRPRGPLPPGAARIRRHRSTRDAWACTTPSFRTSCCIRWACSRSG